MNLNNDHFFGHLRMTSVNFCHHLHFGNHTPSSRFGFHHHLSNSSVLLGFYGSISFISYQADAGHHISPDLYVSLNFNSCFGSCLSNSSLNCFLHYGRSSKSELFGCPKATGFNSSCSLSFGLCSEIGSDNFLANKIENLNCSCDF